MKSAFNKKDLDAIKAKNIQFVQATTRSWEKRFYNQLVDMIRDAYQMTSTTYFNPSQADIKEYINDLEGSLNTYSN